MFDLQKRSILDAKLKTLSVFNFEHALERMGDDVEILREVVKTFLEDIPDKLSILEGIIKSRDKDAAKSFAHNIKGASGNAGLERLFEISSQIELILTEDDIETSLNFFNRMKEEFQEIIELFKNYNWKI